MISLPCRAPFLPAIGLLAACVAVIANAQDAVLQLSNLEVGRGAIASSLPDFSCATTCSTTVATGETVTLTASPTPGNVFESWAGDCSGTRPTCALLMDGTKLAIASFKPAGDPLTLVHRFLSGAPEGGLPGYGDLVADGGWLYGTTSWGGRANGGTIFRELPDGSQFTVLHEFLGAPSDGGNPNGSLIPSGGVLYGMTSQGGAFGRGTVFKVDPDGGGFAVLHSFGSGASDGDWPLGSLVALDGVLYGMTYLGGATGQGTIFKVNLDGSGFALLHSFPGGANDGSTPYGSLTTLNGVLYGMTSQGGAGGCANDSATIIGCGTIFRIDPDGGAFALLHSFTGGSPDGARPFGSLVAAGGALYGMTSSGGAGNLGTIFTVNPNGSGFALLHSFAGGAGDGSMPYGSLTTLYGGLFGMTKYGGVGDAGTVFKVSTNGGGFTLLHSFSGADGSQPFGSLVASGGLLYGMTNYGGTGSLGTIFASDPNDSRFVLLHSFPGSDGDGEYPSGPLLAFGGALYGITSYGGAGNGGTVFKVNPDGSGFALLHSFTGGAGDGSRPYGSLTAWNGALYGMTSWGGAGDCNRWAPGAGGGTIFKINPDGSGFALLHSFGGGASDGMEPYGSLVAFDGVLYGMTSGGGLGGCYSPSPGAPSGNGTIFRIDPDGGGFAVVHSFAGGADDGLNPYGSLIVSDGVLYGMTFGGGPGDCHSSGPGGVLPSGCGTIFKVNPDGRNFALLHPFTGGSLDGARPVGSLVSAGGALYGMTSSGGAGGGGTIVRVNADGSGFAVLHSFAGGAGDGADPSGSLLASGGVLYGMTYFGGTSNTGTLFKIVPDGSGLAILRSFSGADGAYPGYGSALTAVGGSLYGTAPSGGIADGGVLFRLDVGQHQVRRHLLRH